MKPISDMRRLWANDTAAHQAYGNIPRSIEFAVDSASRFIKYCMDNDIVYAEATEQSMTEWTVSRWVLLLSLNAR